MTRPPSRLLPCLLLAFVLMSLPCGRTPAQDADGDRAKQLAQDSIALTRSGSPSRALDLAEQAIELSPGTAAGWAARGYARSKMFERLSALDDYTRAVELEPANPQWYLYRIQCFMAMDRWQAAMDDAETGRKQWPTAAAFLSLHGWCRINLGEVDQGLAEMDETVQKNPGQANYLNRFDGYFFKADWKEAHAEFQRMSALNAAPPYAYFYAVRALVESGDYAGANRIAEECKRRFSGNVETGLCFAYLTGTAAAKDYFDPDRAFRYASELQSNPPLAAMTNCVARISLQAGRYHDALQELVSHGRLTNFDSLLLLGITNLKLGRRADARRHLLEARRLNPYLLRHAEHDPALAEFIRSLDRDVAVEAKAADRRLLSEEQSLASLSVAEMETLLRRFQFDRALTEYEKYVKGLKSPLRKQEAEQRVAQIRGLASAFKRITGKVNAGQVKDLKIKAGALDATLTRTNSDGTFDFTVPKGSGKGYWAGIGVDTMLDVLQRAEPNAEELFALGALAWDSGVPDKSYDLLNRALKADAKLRGRLDYFLSDRLGLAIPEGGFVPWKGRWVTPADKANYEKGLLPWEDQWVTAADREKLGRGLQKVNDKWVPREEAQLLRMGYKKYNDKWYTRDEYEIVRSRWDAAYSLTTDHYEIKTNKSDEFCQELAKVIEVAYAECRKLYFGEEPKLSGNQRMTLYAFATFEDYRKYCADNKCEDHLQAAGFARSDSLTVVGWDKTSNQQMFLQTMAHEAAHLYYFRIAAAARPPSWYAEAMATQLEGFYWDGKAYVYDRVSQSRLPFIQQAVRGERHLKLDELLGGDALKLINADSEKALIFYAECWAFFYYLTHAADPKDKEAFDKFRENIDKGGQRDLKGYFRDPVKLEENFLKFVKGM